MVIALEGEVQGAAFNENRLQKPRPAQNSNQTTEVNRPQRNNRQTGPKGTVASKNSVVQKGSTGQKSAAGQKGPAGKKAVAKSSLIKKGGINKRKAPKVKKVAPTQAELDADLDAYISKVIIFCFIDKSLNLIFVSN
jgi:hypothetical protein